MGCSPRQGRGGALVVCLLVAVSGTVQAATFQGLGHLGGGTSVAWSVSADGSTIIGESTVAGTGSVSTRTRGFIWTSGGGMQDLGFFDGGSGQFRALDVSGDGSIVVGRGSVTTGGREAFSGSTAGLTALGDLAGGGHLSTASSISDNGRVIVGFGSVAAGQVPVIWMDGATTPTALSVPTGTLSGTLLAISGDGAVGGGSLRADSLPRAHRWTPAGGFTDLGTLNSDNQGFSEATGVSQDGSVLVGSSDSALGVQAFAWTSGGGMVGLGDLAGGPFESVARAASADGGVIVGYGTTGVEMDANVHEAFIWDAAHGMRNLQDLLDSLGVKSDGWRLSEAHGISADGNVIVGLGLNPQGAPEAFMVTLVPEPATAGMFLVACGLALARRPVRR